MESVIVTNASLRNSIEKTHRGTIMTTEDGTQIMRSFHFTPEEIGKYIVLKFQYEQNLFWGSILGTRLQINSKTPYMLYGVYRIDWHSDWCRHENNVKYKIKLTPVGNWGAWCPNSSWYTSDLESKINHTYNLFEKLPLFDNENDATEFALSKNFEMYPK